MKKIYINCQKILRSLERELSTTEIVSAETDYNTYAIAAKYDANLKLNDLSGASQSESVNKRLKNDSQTLKTSAGLAV